MVSKSLTCLSLWFDHLVTNFSFWFFLAVRYYFPLLLHTHFDNLHVCLFSNAWGKNIWKSKLYTNVQELVKKRTLSITKKGQWNRALYKEDIFFDLIWFLQCITVNIPTVFNTKYLKFWKLIRPFKQKSEYPLKLKPSS